MSKKNTSFSIWRRIATFLMLALAAGLIGANWFVHEPRAWREKQTASWPAPIVQTVENLGHAFADYTDALGLSGSDVSVDLPVFTPPNGVAFGGLPVPIPGGAARTDVVILQKQTFMLGWSPSLRHAVWAAYRVSPTQTPLDLMRPSSFSQDTAARNAPRSADYARSGYDRGHLVPNHAIASRFGKKAQVETFLTSNIAPQRPALNQGPWADVERRIADDWPDRFGDIWVIVGTISPQQRQTLAAGINIPTAFYQIVVARHADRVRAFAVVMPQRISRLARPRVTLATIDEIEQLSGFDFLSALPDEEETALEAGRPTRLWPSGFRSVVSIIRRRLGVYSN
ncbi:MAG: DNA/RNA non-specific endonuclease [Lentisphaerae bacterium]|nr:DNA/RNA non-specific endonuclease [Lentisphaerota bacterium]